MGEVNVEEWWNEFFGKGKRKKTRENLPKFRQELNINKMKQIYESSLLIYFHKNRRYAEDQEK